MEIGTTDSGGSHFDEYVPRARAGDGKVALYEGRADFYELQRFHGTRYDSRVDGTASRA